MDDSILLRNGNIIDYNGKIVYKKNILIKKGIIAYLGDNTPEANTVLNCEHKFISPSLVNIHTHSPMNLFKGLTDDIKITESFNGIVWHCENKLTEEDVYHSAKVAAAEMLSYGISAYADSYIHPKPIIKAAMDLGIKIDMAPSLFTVANKNTLRDIEETIILNQQYKDNENVVISFGPHSTYTCTEEFLSVVGQYAKDHKLKIHVHVSGTKSQVDSSLRVKGVTPIEILYRAGLLRNRTILANGLHITEGDLKYLNKDTYFAIVPKAHLRLSPTIGEIYNLKDKLQITIGTDGATLSNSLNPLEQVRMLGVMGKYLFKDHTKFSVNELWSLLMKGHEVLDFNSGKIQVGKSADLIIWNLDTPKTQINNNILSSIIYNTDSENIDSTLISGKFIKKEGKLNIDVSDSINYCKYRIDQILSEVKAEKDFDI